MTLFALLLTLSVESAYANSEKVFAVGSQKIVFYHYDEARLTISEKCDEIKKGLFCEKIKFLKNLKDDYKKVDIKQSGGGANSGSQICYAILKGIIVVGVDENKNENSFCKMQNGLLIDSGTLTYYSIK